MRVFNSALVSTLVLTSLPATATDPLSHDVGSLEYPLSFFEQYTPQNAMDMINRLPGFTFDQGAAARGFGGNAGNVLIDGVRPTSKSGGLEGALKRISAAQVERIVILQGGVGAGEAAGQSMVANVVRVKGVTQGSWATKFRRAPDNHYSPNLEAAISSDIAGWQTSFDLDIGGSPGYRTALVENLDSLDIVTSGSDEVMSEQGKWLFVNGEGSSEFSFGKLTLNARLGGDNWHATTLRENYTDRLPDNSLFDDYWHLQEKNKFKMAEFGADLTQINHDWKWRMVALGVINDQRYQYQYHEESRAPIDISDDYFIQERLKTEFIARTTIGKVANAVFKPEYGVEIANNRLDTYAEETNNEVLVAVEGADVVVEEWRAELFATFIYELNASLTLEGGLTTEFSQITVSGDNVQRQNFTFLKPRISATYKIDNRNSLTLESEHRVGQLNFNDFAASTEASDGSTTSGNPDLKPDETTEIAATYDWRFSERGSLKINALYQWRQDILEQIILEHSAEDEDIIQGLGNAGNARFWSVFTELNVPLDLVLPNALLELSYKYRGSKFYDPIIAQNRKINDYTPNWLSFKFRHDLSQQKFAWGLEYWGDFTDTSYRVDEIQTFAGNKRLRMFVESTRFFGLKSQLEITHLNTGRYTRIRNYYALDRGGDFDGREIAYRERGAEIKFSIWGTF